MQVSRFTFLREKLSMCSPSAQFTPMHSSNLRVCAHWRHVIYFRFFLGGWGQKYFLPSGTIRGHNLSVFALCAICKHQPFACGLQRYDVDEAAHLRMTPQIKPTQDLNAAKPRCFPGAAALAMIRDQLQTSQGMVTTPIFFGHWSGCLGKHTSSMSSFYQFFMIKEWGFRALCWCHFFVDHKISTKLDGEFDDKRPFTKRIGLTLWGFVLRIFT